MTDYDDDYESFCKREAENLMSLADVPLCREDYIREVKTKDDDDLEYYIREAKAMY